MNEHEWLTSTDPEAMLTELHWEPTTFSVQGSGWQRRKLSPRKLRLFASAVDNRVCEDHELPRIISWETAGKGLFLVRLAYVLPHSNPAFLYLNHETEVVKEAGLAAALLRCIFGNPFREVVKRPAGSRDRVGRAPDGELWHFTPDEDLTTPDGRRCEEVGYIRQEWLTPDVLALAHTIYTERRFEEMPVLGDALEEAGCPPHWACGCGWRGPKEWLKNSPSGALVCPDCGASGGLITIQHPIVYHCREPLHARGCWVLDLILGKE